MFRGGGQEMDGCNAGRDMNMGFWAASALSHPYCLLQQGTRRASLFPQATGATLLLLLQFPPYVEDSP